MTRSELVFNPVLPVGILVLLSVAAAVGIWHSYGRCPLAPTARRWLVSIRVATVVVLALLLMLPVRRSTRMRVETPAVAVLCDISRSMLDSPADDHEIRRRNAAAFLKNSTVRNRLEQYRTLWFRFGANLEEADDPAVQALVFNAPRTHTHRALNAIARRTRGLNLAGVLLLSDGLDQSAEPLSPEAARIPVFIPELEKPRPSRPRKTVGNDIAVSDIAHPKMLVVFWKGQVDVTVRRLSGSGKLVCPVHLYRGPERLRTAYASFAEGESTQCLSFSVEPFEPGRAVYRVVAELADDVETGNNERQFMIEVTDPKNRILYLEGTPRWEFKFLKRALVKERNYHLSAFVQAAGGRFINFAEDSTGAELSPLPEVVDDELLRYRVIILGEMPRATLTAAQQKVVADYVSKGGGLLVFGGARALADASGWPGSPTLGKILPFDNETGARMREGRFGIVATPAAGAHPVLRGLGGAGELPPVMSCWGPVKPRAAAITLVVTGDDAPVLLVSRYGKGKVAVVLSDSLWRWQLGAAGAGEKSTYERFVSQLCHWLSPQEAEVKEKGDLQVFTRRGEIEVRQPVVVGAIVGETADGSVPDKLHGTVRTPDARELTLDLVRGRLGADVGLPRTVAGWRGEFSPHVGGEYRIRVKTGSRRADVRVLVVEPRVEITGQPLGRAFLQQLADGAGGAFAPLAESATLVERIPFAPVETQATAEAPMWNRVWILALLIVLFSAEWYIRSRTELV